MRFFLLLLLLYFELTFAQNGYYYVKTFKTDYQKETNHLGAFAIADNGVIFTSNSQGILVYDGKNWFNIPVESPVFDLKIVQNQLFYLTDKYLGKISDLTRLPYQTEKYLELQASFKQLEITNQNIFLFSEEEILNINIEKNTHKSIKAPGDGPMGGMIKFKEEIWIAEPSFGMLKINNKTLEFETVAGGEILENQYIQNYYATSEAFYLVTLDNAIYVYESSKFRLLGQYNSAKNSYIYGITVIDEEIIAATNNQGLLVINRKNGQILQQITTIHGLPDNESHAIFLDNHQGIWLAHPFIFSRIYWSKKFEDYSNAVGLIGNIHCLAKKHEQLWVGTDNGLFYLSYEIPKESEMVNFTVSKTIVKRVVVPQFDNSNTQNTDNKNTGTHNKSNTENKTINPQNSKEKKGFLKKLFSKKNKKDKTNTEESSDEKLEPQNESPQQPKQQSNTIVENRYTYQEKVNQIAIKSSESYRKYLVFKPIQGISEIVYDIQFGQNAVYVGTQKGFYEIVNQKIEFKLPVLTNKIIEHQGNIWISSNQKVLKLQKNGKTWEITKSLNLNRYINSLVIKDNYLVGGTVKGFFKTNLYLENPKWFLVDYGNITIQNFKNQVFALTSQQIYQIKNEPTPLNITLPDNYQIIPSHQGIFLFSKSLILSLNEKNSFDTLYYARLLDDVPSFIIVEEDKHLLTGKKAILKFKQKSPSSNTTKVYVRGFSVTGKSFWGTVFKDSLIYEHPLYLAYGDYNIHVKLSTSDLFNPDAVQYFVSINNGNWNLIEGTNWILYNLPAGNYAIALRARLPNGEMTENYYFNIKVALPFWRSWWFYFLLIMFFSAAAYSYTRYKLRKLEEEKRKIEEENQILEQKVQERTKEIAEQKKIIEEKNTEIMDSLRYSERIQQAMLPKEQQIKSIFEHNCFVLYMPRDVVSGDFYWIHEKDNQLLIAAGDCTGHGVPGALMSMIGISLLNRIRDNNIVDPAKILSALHKEIHESLKQGTDNQVLDGMDIALVLYEPHLAKLTFASAMRPIYLIRDNELIVYKGDKKSIGGREPEKQFSTHELFLENGDIFYLFSDGYADQFNPNGEKYQLGRFRKKLLEIHQEPLNTQKVILQNEILNWKSSAEQVDDIMVIGIRYKK